MRKILMVMSVAAALIAYGCSDASEDDGANTTTATGGTAGAGGNDGGSDAGSGGTGGSDGGSDAGGGDAGGAGGTGGAGGEGGAPPAGPCDAVPDGILGVVYTAPENHSPGLVGIAAWVECPPGSQAICESVSWTNSFPGSVAADGVDTTTGLFGARPSGTKLRFIPGLTSADNQPLSSYFFWAANNTVTRVGVAHACVGTERIGGYDEANGFDGAMTATDELANPANAMVTVP